MCAGHFLCCSVPILIVDTVTYIDMHSYIMNPWMYMQDSTAGLSNFSRDRARNRVIISSFYISLLIWKDLRFFTEMT